jgi:hypothetical protein
VRTIPNICYRETCWRWKKISIEFGKVLRPTIIYLLVLSLLVWFLSFQTIEVPSRVEKYLPSFTLNQLLFPLASAASLLYASTLVEKLTKGRLSTPISSSLYRLGYAIPLYLIGQWPQISPFYMSLFSLPLHITLTQGFLNIIDIYLKQYQKISRPLIIGLMVALVGFFLSNTYMDTVAGLRNARTVGELGPELDFILYSVYSDQLINIFRVAIILTTFASFSAVLKNKNNPYLAYLGKYFGVNLFSKFLTFFLLGTYFSILRGDLEIWLGENSQFLSLIEWGLVCIFFYRGYKSINRYAEVFVNKQELVLKWTRHVQDIRFTSDQKLENLSRLVEGFIERGEKNLLEVNLVALMASYHYSPSRIHLTLREFLEYEDQKPGALAFNWQVNYLENMNRENRSNLMAMTLENLEGNRIITSTETVELVENNEVIESESERITG